MFDHTHYVPILKGKEGEFSALRELKAETKDLLTPFHMDIAASVQKVTEEVMLQ